jgi:hypothetical protein
VCFSSGDNLFDTLILVQGVLADNCTSKFGRRRPYMMVGTIICVFAMILLGFTRWFASIFTGWNNESVRRELGIVKESTDRMPE